MNIKSSIWIIMLGMIFLQSCDSNDGILDDDADMRPLVPEVPPEIDPNIPRPPESAQVITTNADQILDVSGNPVLMRGINLQYAQNPDERIHGIAAIRSVGSNVIRLQLTKDTTAAQLEGALEQVTEEGIIAILSFWGPEGEIACTGSSSSLDSAVQNLWLNAWMPVLSQARFQPYIMLNIASGWGPASVFTASASQSYEGYVAAYKEYIGRFRQMGFKVPLVIDAPGCGEDHFAFVGGRASELLAADPEGNIVLSVQAFRDAWSSERKIRENIGDLQRLPAPFIVGSFGGSGVPSGSSLDHDQLMYMATGNQAMQLSFPWSGPEDVVAMSYPLGETKDIFGLSVTFEAYIPQSYIDAGGSLSMQLVMENANGEYALSQPSLASTRFRNRWNRYNFIIAEAEDLAEQSTNFDSSQVSRVGIRVAANGKASNVSGDILIDNFAISAAPDPIYVSRFNGELDGWARAWGANGTNAVTVQDQALAVLPDWGGAEQAITVRTSSIANAQPPLNLQESFTVSFKIFVPEEYASETGLALQPFMQDGDDWTHSGIAFIPFRSPDFQFGEWETVTITQADFENYIQSDGYAGNDGFDTTVRPNAIGVEVANVTTAKTQPILIDDFKVEGSEPTTFGRVNAYDSDLANWTFGWGAGGNDSLSYSNGVLSILAPWGAGSPSTAVLHDGIANLATPINIDEPFILTFDIFIPTEYSSESTMAIQPFVLDPSANKVFGSIKYISVGGNIALGQWQTVEVAINDFESEANNFDPATFVLEGPINGIGLEVAQVQSAKTEPVQIRNFKVDVLIEEDSSAMFELEFETDAEITDFAFIDRTGLSNTDWLTTFGESVKTRTFGIQPFGWVAWSWIGNEDLYSGWDISLQEGFGEPGNPASGVDLTDRGEDIVNGVYGIMMTAEPAVFSQ